MADFDRCIFGQLEVVLAVDLLTTGILDGNEKVRLIN